MSYWDKNKITSILDRCNLNILRSHGHWFSSHRTASTCTSDKLVIIPTKSIFDNFLSLIRSCVLSIFLFSAFFFGGGQKLPFYLTLSRKGKTRPLNLINEVENEERIHVSERGQKKNIPPFKRLITGALYCWKRERIGLICIR